MSQQTAAGSDLELAYIELYVQDLDAQRDFFVERYRFRIAGTAGSADEGFRSVALTQGRVTLVLTEGSADEHPATGYVESHGDGVADIAMRTHDVEAVFASAVAAGAVTDSPLRGDRDAVTASVRVLGDIGHTFIQTVPGADPAAVLPAGFTPVPPRERDDAELLDVIDHFALCVPVGYLDEAVAFYTSALAFEQIFEEWIVVGGQAMNSKVVRNATGSVTFTIIEPDPNREQGQIDEFLKNHDGSGIQHVAFATGDIIDTVEALRRAGVEFLKTPGAYYDVLTDRIVPDTHTVEELRAQDVLVDQDESGEMFQIFTRSTHPRKTLFFEVIERMGAQTFGSANIKALYEAVELERSEVRLW